MNINAFLEITTIVSATLSVLLIILQQRGASLGAGFGGSGELYTTRRGLDKSLFNATVVFVTVFVLSILVGLFLPNFS
ncbi:MAG: preprotein translocase subunit SecG [Candidatus Nomurabacteria bacterium]|nr:preprotein translocase subunit SecG [Candidatus Nomurabacteria bacterium]